MFPDVFVTGCAVDGVDGVDGGKTVPKFVIRYIFSQPAFDPRRSAEYDYWLTYELENGVWHFVYIEENPLTMDVIKKAVADDIARLIEIYEKTDKSRIPPTSRRKESSLMELHDLIGESQDCITDAITAEHRGDLSSAYNHIDRLYDLLTEEFVPMEAPVCESSESSNGS